MRNFGQLLLVLGVLAIGLDLVDRVPTVLMWIYNWGDAVAWGIKIGLIVVGAALFFLGGAEEDEAPAEE